VRLPSAAEYALAVDEGLRSLQLCGVDPDVTAAAVRMVAEEGRPDHVDLNFG
jgi:tRNA-dihydrouridine synthase